MQTYRELLEQMATQAATKFISVFPGKFAPLTNGHLKVILEAYKETGFPTLLFAMTRKNEEDQILNDKLKDEIFEVLKNTYKDEIFDIRIVNSGDMWSGKLLDDVIKNGTGIKNILCGEDRKNDYLRLIKRLNLNDVNIKVTPRDKNSISATQLRSFIINKDFKSAKTIMPSCIWKFTPIIYNELIAKQK